MPKKMAKSHKVGEKIGAKQQSPVAQLQWVKLATTSLPSRIKTSQSILRVPRQVVIPQTPSSNDMRRARVILGPDDRQPVNDVHLMPYRVICLLEPVFPNGRERVGTGSLIGPRTVVTAAHNVYKKNFNGGVTALRVTPGAFRNDEGQVIAPFGVVNVDVSSCLFPDEWKDESDSDELSPHDYAVIRLPDSATWNGDYWGNSLGALTLVDINDRFTADWFLNAVLFTSGYPAGQTDGKPLGMQFWSSSRATPENSQFLRYSMDTEPGQSGSPVFFVTPHNPTDPPPCFLTAIHTTGEEDVGNFGLRICDKVFQDLSNWKN